MTIFDATIMGGNLQLIIESNIVKICGIDFDHYLDNKKTLSKEIFEENFSKIIEFIEGCEDYVVAFQVCGALILQTGSCLPVEVKEKILEYTNWELEESFWSKPLIVQRKFCLSELRQKIIDHKPGIPSLLTGVVFP